MKPLNGTLTGIANPDLSGAGSNENEKIIPHFKER